MAGEYPPWVKLRGESAKAYEAFKCYRDFGADRSTARVAQALGKSKTLMDRWSARWEWVKRVDAWDDHQQQLSIQAAEETARLNAARWADERAQWRERELAIAKSLVTKAEQMLGFPLVVTRLEEVDGKLIEIHEPGRWRFADAARMVDVASKLARLASEMETERMVVQRSIKDLAAEFGFSEAEVEEQYKAILAARG